MKKSLSVLMFFCVCLSMIMVCYAGDIPESQLSTDSAQTFIAEIKELAPDSITVVQKHNFKGEFEAGKECTYADNEKYRPSFAKVGETVLCCYLDEINFNMFEIKSFDGEKIKLKSDAGMMQRLEDYINNGDFEKAEKERLSKKGEANQTGSASAIGGADGPTDIVVKSNVNIWLICGACALIILAIIVFVVKKRKTK